MKRILSLSLAFLLLLAVITGCSTSPDPAQSPAPEADSGANAPQTSTQEVIAYADTVAWDYEYDVVVVGFGGAGAVTSIAAAEEGAKVLMTEKAPEGHEGGNTRYSYQIILNYLNYEDGVAYLKAECQGMDHMSDEIIDFIVKGSMENPDWMESMGMLRPEARYVGGEYPELPGSQSVVFTYVPDTGAVNGKHYWESVRAGVVKRNEKIDVWYESPATRLIQDPFSKTVLGVEIERDGKAVNVRATNGVVLACGGFENNEEMIEHYTQREALYPIGTLYNTGDGIKMAQDVGADLWHMAALSGPWLTIKTDEMEQAWFNQPSMNMNLTPNTHASIYVGSTGMRFAPEAGTHRHGHINYAGNFYSQISPNPMYMIFDQKTVDSFEEFGPLMPAFSQDLSAEIEKGYVTKADTIAELAEKIGVCVDSAPPNIAPMEKSLTSWFEITYREMGLVNQVERYNRYCKNGYDEQFDRKPETLVPIDTAPYYAIEIKPGIVNTQGGPKRNLECEVLDTNGDAIPNLYSAGELGSMYGGYYTGGGNIAETLFSGRVAGKNAAQPKSAPDAQELKSVASSLKSHESDLLASKDVGTLAQGETVGVGNGMGGDLTVKVKQENGTIVSIEVLSHSETPVISDKALDEIPNAIITAGSTEVDAIAGATITSNAIKEAVADALSK
ncbi:FAD-binding protein [Christensenellaceae bacterium OttesenSCG-928-M15]|nr:FAD-binding protein [Christensenellaceae bacterium OttesenSCG-928-M15]